MPQLDFFSYATTTSTLFISFILLVFIVDWVVIPKILNTLKTRSLILKGSDEIPATTTQVIEDVFIRNVLKNLELIKLIKKTYIFQSVILTFMAAFILLHPETMIIIGFIIIIFGLRNGFGNSTLAYLLNTTQTQKKHLENSITSNLIDVEKNANTLYDKISTSRSLVLVNITVLPIITASKNSVNSARNHMVLNLKQTINQMFNLERIMAVKRSGYLLFTVNFSLLMIFISCGIKFINVSNGYQAIIIILVFLFSVYGIFWKLEVKLLYLLNVLRKATNKFFFMEKIFLLFKKLWIGPTILNYFLSPKKSVTKKFIFSMLYIVLSIIFYFRGIILCKEDGELELHPLTNLIIPGLQLMFLLNHFYYKTDLFSFMGLYSLIIIGISIYAIDMCAEYFSYVLLEHPYSDFSTGYMNFLQDPFFSRTEIAHHIRTTILETMFLGKSGFTILAKYSILVGVSNATIGLIAFIATDLLQHFSRIELEKLQSDERVKIEKIQSDERVNIEKLQSSERFRLDMEEMETLDKLRKTANDNASWSSKFGGGGSKG